MNRIEAKEFYPILQAFAEGRMIECRTKPSAVKKVQMFRMIGRKRKRLSFGIIQSTESSQNQSTDLSRMQKSAGMK